MIIDIVGNVPERQSIGAAGVDLKCAHDFEIGPGERILVLTGTSIALPQGYEGQVRPRSGLALKYGITVLNAPGTIDSDYRGEIGVILINHGVHAQKFAEGDRIAQLVISPVVSGWQWNQVDELSKSTRGVAGFGSTGR